MRRCGPRSVGRGRDPDARQPEARDTVDADAAQERALQGEELEVPPDPEARIDGSDVDIVTPARTPAAGE